MDAELEPSCSDWLPSRIRTSASDASGSFFGGSLRSEDGAMEASGLEFELDFDLRALRDSLAAPPDALDESGYASALARSSHSAYGTGWILADSVSLPGDEDDWDGYMEVGSEKVRITEMSDLLATRYAFLTGAKGAEGVGLVSFPDVRTSLSFPDYRRLLTYVLHVPALEESQFGYVVVADRRSDKWSSVKTLLVHLSAFFPGCVRVVFVVKPEGVLQRALELGYKSLADDCAFKVIICQNVGELHRYVDRSVLSLDFGGRLKYNHLEWVQHRMDIERMRSSAGMIAGSLEEFSRCLRDTELPNDAATTTHILTTQSAERDAIQEEFRIAVRRGQTLLGRVRQADAKPRHTQLSPTRLGNVTAIQRMLIQLDETERSFESFWARHHRRLSLCLDLRRFEEDFRRLQCSFAGRMLQLEETREVGESGVRADELLRRHKDVALAAQEEMDAAAELSNRGEELMGSAEGGELGGSLGPKCEELRRMAEALSAALAARLAALTTSQGLHAHIAAANSWCREGVELLGHVGVWEPTERASLLARLESFLASTPAPLQSFLAQPIPEASELLRQVSERIADVRSLCETQRAHLARSLEAPEKTRPVQVVSPAKTPKTSPKRVAARRVSKPRKEASMEIRVLHPSSSLEEAGGSPQLLNVAQELLRTEQLYCDQLASVLTFYLLPLRAHDAALPSFLRGVETKIFANLSELAEFHSEVLLPELSRASQPSDIAAVFRKRMERLGPLYTAYCQARPESDALLAALPQPVSFLLECQRRAAHPLPLSAYLLKPVQRISKYHLLLWEMAKEAEGAEKAALEAAWGGLRELLHSLNAAVAAPNISAYPGDVRGLGRPLLEANFLVYPGRKSKDRTASTKLRKPQSRSRLVFAKRREPSSGEEYFEFKMEIKTSELRLHRMEENRLEVSEASKAELWCLQPEERNPQAWADAIRRLESGSGEGRPERPHSWGSSSSSSVMTSTPSSSNRSSRDLDGPGRSSDERNNNPASPDSATPRPADVDNNATGPLRNHADLADLHNVSV